MTEKRKSKKRKEEYDSDKEETEKATKEEYSVAKWLRSNVPTKKTKFLSHHVEYFTGAKAVDALLTSKWSTGKTPLFTTRVDVIDFLNEMLVHKFFHRAKKVPVSAEELKGKVKAKKKDGEKTVKSGDESGKDAEERQTKDADEAQAQTSEGKDTKESKESKEKRKRKIRLDMHMEQVFLDTADAYVWIYDPIPMHYWFAGFAVVLGAIGVCMFPLWPPTVRMGVYYLSIAGAGFLTFILFLAALRVVVFCLVWTLSLTRHHLWLLPNLVEDVGFFESFWPLYHYEYRGPSAAPPTKSKKKKKKDKNSDEETEDAPAPAPAVAPPTAAPSAADKSKHEPDVAAAGSDSENSQRSSTDRDFEIVDSADVSADADADNDDADKDDVGADKGDVKADVDTGDVKADVDTGDVKADADTGDVKADADTGDVKADADTGDVKADADTGDVKANTS